MQKVVSMPVKKTVRRPKKKSKSVRKSDAKKSQKKKVGKNAKLPRPLRKFQVTLQSTQHEYYASRLDADELKQLKGSGIPLDDCMVTLSELDNSIGGTREVSVDLDYLQADVDGVELAIIYPTSKTPKTSVSYRRKTIIYGYASVSGCIWTADVEAVSIDEIRVECHFSERWILPNGEQVNIYTVSVTGEDEADLQYEDGGTGGEDIYVYLSNGKVVNLSEDMDDSGATVIRIDE